jgi:hypothetical protein
MAALASCGDAADVLEMVAMYLEQGEMVISENDAEMAGDVISFMDEAQANLDEIKTVCGGGAPAPSEETPSPDEAPAP